MLKPVMPYISDAIAHILFFKDHMATVHAHNGKFHVHLQVSEAAKNDNSDKSANILKKDASDNEHIIAQKSEIDVIKKPIPEYSATVRINFSHIFLPRHFPPPKA